TVTSSGGTLRYTAANSELTLAGNAGDDIEVSGPWLIDGDGDITMDEVLEGTGDITKSGNGRLAINAANTLSGSIAVTAGELRLNGSFPSSEGMNVQAAATLSGSGTYTPPITLAGTLAPGDGVGVLTTGPLNFESGARIEWQVGDWSAAPSAGHDRVEAASVDLTDATGLVIAVSDEDITNFSNSPSAFVVLRSTAPITGFDINQFEIDASGFTAGLGNWELAIQGNDLVLEYTPLPPFEAWQITEFGVEAENPAVAGENADPDQDGVINLMEYALASDPNSSEPATWFVDRVTVEGTEYLRMNLQRNPAATDVTYTVETAGDLAGPGSWSSANTFIEAETPSELVVRDTLAGPIRFIRLRVSR
ncbi:MAG: hypothetical protein MUF13_06020, partial [Akkermansiaceae bacterium]|nr:hypothetical protein [Akkermansiaceae bacterium]